MRFGVHVSIGGGFAKAAREAQSVGCEALQIFVGNPRGWARKPLAVRDAEDFRQALDASGLGPVVAHLSYLPNPASLKDEMYERSISAMAEDFERANRLGAGFFVCHPGHCPREERAEGTARLVKGLETVLARVDGPTVFLLENQGHRHGDVGADLEELALLLKRFDPARVGVCLDTCHAFVAGYDLRQKEGWDQVLSITGERLRVIHANDSKGDLGSGLDRHQHIGEGFLGAKAFQGMRGRAVLAGLPVILETPQNGPDDDRRNLARIRALTAGED